ncbi:FAD dependent oxidoreductase [Crenothrix polyspora]|uniref:FAD dependent oxidoreductase n=1 Tax=Crenothrix polyspora TaxID=360316 RepID=A0A1R4H9L2_9GAMM|nr:FAD-binding oxidoreductase [Crenothrix polyspora]SJM92948.1 FAD dependent oxidoreductase [Crenothrix polyspora]
MTIDFLIIGQGLAGSLLAWELIQRGCTVVIVDNGKESASQVAAGLINPITGMRLVKSNDIDTLLPVAKQLYAQLAIFFQQPFYIEKPMLRIFRNVDECRYGLKRSTTPQYQPYLSNNIVSAFTIDHLKTPFGYLEQKQTGYLLTRPLLKCLKNFFIASNRYQCTDFNYQDVQFSPSLYWQNINPKTIVFCEGHQAMQNPWFSWLPFQPVKGEILTLHHQTHLPNKILNYGHWLIPLNDQQIRVGATFDRDNINLQTTVTGKNSLLDALNVISDNLSTATLIKHQAHIRPCTLDKQPFIGHHPHHKQLAIFNGFGAKGSLYIPWYSQLFAGSLLNNTPLPCPIARHYETHFPG